MKNFDLLGHDCPYGSYPAPVVAIGRLGNQLQAVYSPFVVEQLEQDTEYVVHDTFLSATLDRFDYTTDRLFAYASDEIVIYKAAGEREFLISFLASSRSRDVDPFFRLMLAKRTGRRTVVRNEIDLCYQQLQKRAPGYAESWREKELATLSKEILVVYSHRIEESPLVEIVRQAIAQHGDLFVASATMDSQNSAGVLPDINQACMLIAISLQLEGVPMPEAGISYALGVAAALRKPVLAVTDCASSVPLSEPAPAVVEYQPAEFTNDKDALALRSRISDEISRLKLRIVPAGTSRRLLTEEFRQPAQRVFQFANSIRIDIAVLQEHLEEARRIVSEVPGRTPQLRDIRESWGEYERFHNQGLSKRLNGAATEAKQAFEQLQETCGLSVAELGEDFKRLWTAAQSYPDAFEKTRRSVREERLETAELFEVIEPLDQILRNLAIGADRVIAGLAWSILAPSPS
jgi:hypothetical protein